MTSGFNPWGVLPYAAPKGRVFGSIWSENGYTFQLTFCRHFKFCKQNTAMLIVLRKN